MSLTSLGGDTNIKTGGKHIFHLVETPRGSLSMAKLEQ